MGNNPSNTAEKDASAPKLPEGEHFVGLENVLKTFLRSTNF